VDTPPPWAIIAIVAISSLTSIVKERIKSAKLLAEARQLSAQTDAVARAASSANASNAAPRATTSKRSSWQLLNVLNLLGRSFDAFVILFAGWLFWMLMQSEQPATVGTVAFCVFSGAALVISALRA
jgi:hypothetical protein